ncbi:hypothetical protein Tco_0294426 [Tanacetum coccineum]
MKEVRKKSLRDFHKTHPSGSGTVAKKPPSVDKITPTVISDGTGDKPGVPDVTEDDSTKSESESWGNDEDNSNNDQDSSNGDSEQENESEEQVFDSEQEEESEDDDQEEEDDDVIKGDKEIVQGEGADAEMTDAQQGNENLETTQKQVFKDAHVTISTVMKKTEIPITSSSRSSDLASKFLNFSDIPHTDAKIVSPLYVHVHHEVPKTQAPTLLTIPVSVITESSPVYTNIPQSSQTVTPPPILTTPNPPPTIETTNPLSTLPDFASVFQFNDRITALEKEVSELKKDPLHTQIRPKEVSKFAPPAIEALIKESRDEVTLAKVSSQPHSTYEAASTLTEFELKKILIDKIEKSKSYLAAPEHQDCYESLKKSYNLDKDSFFSYDVYSLEQSRKDKDKDEEPSARSDRVLKKRKLSKDAEPTTGPKNKDSTSSSSKGTKSQPKSSENSVQSEEPYEPRNETDSRRNWFKKPTPPQEPTDPDRREGKIRDRRRDGRRNNDDDDDAEGHNHYEVDVPINLTPPDSRHRVWRIWTVASLLLMIMQLEVGDTVGTITREGIVHNILNTKVKGLAQQMVDRANTEHSTLKRLSVMDRYLVEFDTDLSSEIKGQHALWRSVCTLEDQIRELVQGDREENKKLKTMLESTQRDFDRLSWHHHNLPESGSHLWFVYILPFRHYRERPYVAPTTLVDPVARADLDDPSTRPTRRPRSDDPYVMVRDAAARDEGDDVATTGDPQLSQPPGSPHYHL